MYILGISAYYHDSAAALINDGDLIAAAQEERFSRKKQDSGFPTQAVLYCLKEAKLDVSDVDYIAFYEKPYVKFERLLETYLEEAPKGFKSFFMSMPIWIKEKLFQKNLLTKEFLKIGDCTKQAILQKLLFSEHHIAHLSSAFFPSPFDEAAILAIDGVGEWATTSLAYGQGNNINILNEIHFPHSLGLLYSAFTYYTGFKVNSGEYKVMGLAPYGEPNYVQTIRDNLIDIKDDGSFRLNMDYFNYTTGLTMTNNKFHKLFGAQPRYSEGKLTQREMDLAASIQVVTEDVMLKMAVNARNITGSKNLCLAGGVALNCVANGKILNEKIFDDLWIQPAAGDAGGALGAALAVHYMELGNKRKVVKPDAMKGSFLGPRVSNDDAKAYFDSIGAVYRKIDDFDELSDLVVDALINETVIGWHQGRMEYGPRALGARSIIGDARSTKMQSMMNLKIKYRESFRPFAPSVLRERVADFFEMEYDSPYMLLVAQVNKNNRNEVTKDQKKLFGIEKLNIPRSSIPAVTHVDYSARIQTVHKEINPRYYEIIKKLDEKTGCALIVNTSFNVRGEPIVCTTEDSYRCFMRTEMDVLVVEDYILYKQEQPNFEDKSKWQDDFQLD